MAKGPQLTQRKIDKLRDALNVVRETDQVAKDSYGYAKLTLAFSVEVCAYLEEFYIKRQPPKENP